MGHVRAKFRVLHITHHLDNHSKVDLAPVIGSQGESSDENKSFWKATPSGSFELGFQGEPDPVFVLGGYVYLDVVSDPEGLYSLSGVNLRLGENNSDTVELSYRRHWGTDLPDGLTSGKLVLHIDNKAAMEHFPEPSDGWSVIITEAPA